MNFIEAIGLLGPFLKGVVERISFDKRDQHILKIHNDINVALTADSLYISKYGTLSFRRHDEGTHFTDIPTFTIRLNNLDSEVLRILFPGFASYSSLYTDTLQHFYSYISKGRVPKIIERISFTTYQIFKKHCPNSHYHDYDDSMIVCVYYKEYDTKHDRIIFFALKDECKFILI
jgi:hypothetical protein